MKKFNSMWVFMLISIYSSNIALGQINCNEFFKTFDSLNYNTFHILPGYDKSPFPEDGFENMYQMINKQTELDFGGVVIKALVLFTVDTLGYVQCAQALENDNELFNARAVEIVKQIRFIPAERKGKKVVAPMVLPITFREAPKKRKK